METAAVTLPGEDKERECLAGKRHKLFIRSTISFQKKKNHLEIAFRTSVCQYVVGGQRKVWLILEFPRPFLKMDQNMVSDQLFKLPNSAGFSQAKFPLFVASSVGGIQNWAPGNGASLLPLPQVWCCWHTPVWLGSGEGQVLREPSQSI